ncbi:MAG: hypothetical protein J5J00_09875 [Deltaproteobacteria bacterium]|nr:hypothetical protein [Deltaproteobacteria bacterium]
MSLKSAPDREALLAKCGENTLLIPHELVLYDFLTDSLQHRLLPRNANATDSLPPGIDAALPECFAARFGMPHAIPLSQGRLAEAFVAKLLVRNGHVIPGSAPFPTLRAHIELSGGTYLPVVPAKAFDLWTRHPFKGDLDTEALEAVITRSNPEWVPFVCIEPCNNACGGQPMSLANLKAVKEITDRFGIPLLLDACRVIENAILIKESEPGQNAKSPWEIVREIFSLADICVMSATKDFYTPIGGFLAFRKRELYEMSFDLLALLGDGLAHQAKTDLLSALSNEEAILSLVQTKISNVRALHEGLKCSYNVVEPAGGHAVVIDISGLELKPPFAVKNFLRHIYMQWGIRASEHGMESSSAIRLAVPLCGVDQSTINQTVSGLRKAAEQASLVPALKKVDEPAGFTGFMRARFKCDNK